MIIHFDNICSTTTLVSWRTLCTSGVSLEAWEKKRPKNSIIYENLSTCFCCRDLTFGQSRWCFIGPPPICHPRYPPVWKRPSSPTVQSYSDPHLRATGMVRRYKKRCTLDSLGKTGEKQRIKTGRKRKVLVVVYKEYPATSGQLGSCFFAFVLFVSFRVGYKWGFPKMVLPNNHGFSY